MSAEHCLNVHFFSLLFTSFSDFSNLGVDFNCLKFSYVACYCFTIKHEPFQTTITVVTNMTYPKSGCLGYRQTKKIVVNAYFANCVRQPERKLPRPIYNRILQL